MVDDTADAPASIGWFRAILTAVAITVVGVAGLVYGTNAILTRVHGRDRGTLVGIATATFFLLLLMLAWALRRLQQRHVI